MQAKEATIVVMVGEVGKDIWIGLASCGGLTGKSVGRHQDPVAAGISALTTWVRDHGELALAMAFDGSSFEALENAMTKQVKAAPELPESSTP